MDVNGCSILILFCLLPGSTYFIFFSNLLWSWMQNCTVYIFQVPLWTEFKQNALNWRLLQGLSQEERQWIFLVCTLPALWLSPWLHFSTYGSCWVALQEDTTPTFTWLFIVSCTQCVFLFLRIFLLLLLLCVFLTLAVFLKQTF